MGKKAVHFGAGNIGRGFVAEFLHKSGYEVVFADVMESIIGALQRQSSYKVVEVGADGEHEYTISNYRAINSKENEAQVVEEIASADLVTCAVGPNILKFIAPVIAKGIEARTSGAPLAVIACENAIGATDTLAGFIKDEKNTPKDRLATIDQRATFANSAIDRIVPAQDNQSLDVKIEQFYDWVIEVTPFKGGQHPPIQGVKFVETLDPYIERKLFTVNTGHATAAYFGYVRGHHTVNEALDDPEIKQMVKRVLAETSRLIVAKHEFSEQEQGEYARKIIKRISNPHLEDLVERVGREPMRKLSRKERFINPASQLVERGERVDALLGAIEATLLFQNVEGDKESAELAKILKQFSAKDATARITGLETDHPLFGLVEKVVLKVQEGSSSRLTPPLHSSAEANFYQRTISNALESVHSKDRSKIMNYVPRFERVL
ncbi:mannitol-1-phosphate 5-dehydrogenase [Xylona heveae TC161]|uniref:Mannitol-1-phosphate 5-dehydrogenase n=1 Tax=Xylona heveae (strain CBS 132557 / TC161) TaxID=1328760 RepID=A0A165IV71_XYLHT|nr:mannitol-1-phosphate 5-dehydrogenase [Xylona heveae TC161]KZF25434.1 mannitol-1-phosphate 5-dehydrogenase [Xylona heveae TC161]